HAPVHFRRFDLGFMCWSLLAVLTASPEAVRSAELTGITLGSRTSACGSGSGLMGSNTVWAKCLGERGEPRGCEGRFAFRDLCSPSGWDRLTPSATGTAVGPPSRPDAARSAPLSGTSHVSLARYPSLTALLYVLANTL